MKVRYLIGWVVLAACGDQGAEQRYDLLLTNGTVYDGAGGEPREVNVGIVDGRIAGVDVPADAAAEVYVDVAGLMVAPGFIDPHTHTLDDLADPATNANANYLLQGVTTVIVGSDGGGVPNFEQTLGTLTNQGVGTNVAFHVGHNDVRETVMGLENRPPNPEELELMRAIVAEQMQAGRARIVDRLVLHPRQLLANR